MNLPRAYATGYLLKSPSAALPAFKKLKNHRKIGGFLVAFQATPLGHLN